MLIKRNFVMSLVLGLAVVAAVTAASTLFADAMPSFHLLSGHGPEIGTVMAQIPLVTMRTNRGELVTRAEAKLAEVKADTPAERARAIENEHAELLRQIADLDRDIAAAELAERSSPPANTNLDTVRAEAARAERQRADTITDLATRMGVPDFAATHVNEGTSVERFRELLIDHVAERSDRTHVNGQARNTGLDEVETRRSAMIEALSYGMGAPVPREGPSPAARQYMGRRMVGLAVDITGYRLDPVPSARQIDELFTRASHTTSDFPLIFGGAINRTLEQRYALAQPTFRRFARKKNFRDFRPEASLKVGDFPLLQKVNEAGEIKYGTFTEGKEQVSVLSYAIALRITRQMLINDDIGAIDELLTSYGDTVALFEEVTFYSTAFNANLADGKAVFHADHGNLAAAGTVIDVANVGKARAAMSKQKSISGNPLLTNRPRILLTGPDKLTEAEQLLTSITANETAKANIFSGRLEPVETSQIEGNPWYLFGDPSTGSNYRWGYLEGYEAPRVRFDEPFGHQGFAMSVEHDFGCGAVDFRFGYKNPGAAPA
ncbi:phage major capsid protein [Bosea sp. (in: a-proteobacteria)]